MAITMIGVFNHSYRTSGFSVDRTAHSKVGYQSLAH